MIILLSAVIIFASCEKDDLYESELRDIADTAKVSGEILIPESKYMGVDFNGYTHYLTFTSDSVNTAVRLSTSSDAITFVNVGAKYEEIVKNIVLCTMLFNGEQYDYNIIYRYGDNFVVIFESWEKPEFDDYDVFIETGTRVVCFEVENFNI